MEPIIYSSNSLDFDRQAQFLNGFHLRFNHLDWVPGSTWLSSPFSYTLMEKNEIQAMISCANESPHAAWVRYFVCSQESHHPTAFSRLLNLAKHDLSAINIPVLYCLAAHEWVQRLLEIESFTFHDEIITLHLDPKNATHETHPTIKNDPSFAFRPIQKADLDDIYQLDQKAFPAMWQLGLPNLKRCLEVSNVNLLAMKEDRPVAYLMSENIFGNQHLSRIAVDPVFQKQQIAATLVNDLLKDGLSRMTNSFSVNTNRANQASLALYKKFGFQESVYTLPVYAIHLTD